MTWSMVEIRAKPSDLPSGHCMDGIWAHRHAERIAIHNGSTEDFTVSNAPTELTGRSTRVAKGATGVFEGSQLPWSVRLEAAVSACTDSERTVPIVVVMDAPAPTEVHDALGAIGRTDVLAGLTETLFLLCGPAEVLLPTMIEDHLVYDGSAWETLKENFPFFAETTTHGASRLEVPMAMHLGSYTLPAGMRTAQIDYPDGMTMPASMIPFVTYSANAMQPRVSTTGGISLRVTDENEVVARVILEGGSDAEKPAMTALRHSCSSDEATVAVAYFTLVRMKDPKYAAIAARAARAISTKWLGPPPPQPVTRAQSCFHSPDQWR